MTTESFLRFLESDEPLEPVILAQWRRWMASLSERYEAEEERRILFGDDAAAEQSLEGSTTDD